MKIKKNIKNIIFDLGGVILNIDYNLTSNSFKKLGIRDFDLLYSQAKQNNLFDDFETGKISSDEFRSYIKQFIPNCSDKNIDDAWNAMLLDLPKDRLNLLNNVNKKYRIFLLSNTNEIHINKFTEYIKTNFGGNIFDDIFENYYYSSDIGFRKPNKDAFEYVIYNNNLIAEETLFIDDSIQHIEGANKIGLNTIFIDESIDITSLEY